MSDIRVDDGHSTLIEFSQNPSAKFWEKSVKPPGMSGGGPNDTTTMHNTVVRTQAPKKLITMTSSTFTAAYAVAVLPDIIAMMNINQIIKITFPDGSAWFFWGWLDEFDPAELVEGEQPEASCTIEPSNQNASGAEVVPVYAVGGSTTTTTPSP